MSPPVRSGISCWGLKGVPVNSPSRGEALKVVTGLQESLCRLLRVDWSDDVVFFTRDIHISFKYIYGALIVADNFSIV